MAVVILLLISTIVLIIIMATLETMIEVHKRHNK